MASVAPDLLGEFSAWYILGYHLTFPWTQLLGDSLSCFDQLVHPSVSPLVTFAEDVPRPNTCNSANYSTTLQPLAPALEIIQIFLSVAPVCEISSPSTQMLDHG